MSGSTATEATRLAHAPPMASSSSTASLNSNPRQNNHHPVNGNAVNQQPPQRQPSGPPASNNGTETRLKIVEILANTANGCLAELGYYPGMPQKLAELERLNKKWQNENVQLYQDNQTLLMKLQEQERRLNLVQAPEVEKVARIVQLEKDVQRLRTQRDELRQGKPASSATDAPDYYTLHRELQARYTGLCDAYRAAYSEVHHYRKQIGLQPYAVSEPIPQIVQNVQATRVHSAPVVPSQYPLAPMGHQAQVLPPQPQPQPGAMLPNQHVAVQSPVAISPSHSIPQQGRGRPNEQMQMQQPYGQIKQGTGSNPPSRRSSMAVPPQHPLHQVPTQALVSPNVVDPPVRPFSTPPPPAISRIARQQHPPPLAHQYAHPVPIQTTQTPPTQSSQNAGPVHDQQQVARRPSNPNTPVNGVYPPNPYLPSAFHPTARRITSQAVPSSSLRSGSEPLSISTNHDPNHPPTPSADYPPPPMSASAIPSRSSPFAPPLAQQNIPPASSVDPTATALPTPPQSAEQNAEPAVTTTAPYDMLLEKPLFVMQQQMQQQQQVFGTPRYTPPVPQHPVSSGTPLQSYSPNPSMHAPSSSRSSASGTPIPAGAVSGGTPLQSYNPYPPAPGPSRLSGTPPVAFSAPPVVSSAPVVVPSAPSVAPPTSAVVSSDAPPVASLKRDSFSMVDGHGREEESQKKARLESPVFQPEPVQLAPSYPEPQTSIPPPSSPAAVPPTSLPPPPPGPSSPILALAEEAPTTTNLPPPPPPPPPPAQDEDQEMEDEEEGEGLVEVGPDGLRLVKDCLEELFEEDEDSPGHRMCRLCTVRHQKGLISEPPTAFVNATDEELEAHCLAEHDQVWEVLRKVGG